MSDFLTQEEFDSLPDAPMEEPSWGDVLGAGTVDAIANMGGGAAGLGKFATDLIGYEDGSAFFDDTMSRAQDLRNRANEVADPEVGGLKAFGRGAVGASLPLATALMGGGILAPASAMGLLSAGQKYEALDNNPDIGFGRKALDTLATGAVQTGANLIPFTALNKTGMTGPLLSRFYRGVPATAAAGGLGSGISYAGDLLTDRTFAPENLPGSIDELESNFTKNVVMGAGMGGLMKGAQIGKAAFTPRVVDVPTLQANYEPDMAPVDPGFSPLEANVPEAQLALPAPEGVIFGDNFTATDVPGARVVDSNEIVPAPKAVDPFEINTSKTPDAETNLALDTEAASIRSQELQQPDYIPEALAAKPPVETIKVEEGVRATEAETKAQSEEYLNSLKANDDLITKLEEPKVTIKPPSEDSFETETSTTSKQLPLFGKLKEAIKSERGAVDPSLLGLPKSKALPQQLEKIANSGPPEVKKLFQGKIAQLRMLDTVAEKIPELRPAVDGLVGASEDSIMYRAQFEKVLKDALDVAGDEKVNRYVYEKDALGKRFVDSAQERIKFGLDEKQSKAVDAIDKFQKMSSGLMEELVIKEAQHDAKKAIRNIQLTKDMAPQEKANAIAEVNKNTQARIQRANKIRNEWDSSNYAPRDREGDIAIRVTKNGVLKDVIFTTQKNLRKELSKIPMEPGIEVVREEVPVKTGFDSTVHPDLAEFFVSGDKGQVEGFGKHLIERNKTYAGGYETDAVKAWSNYATGLAKKIALTDMRIKLEDAVDALPRDPRRPTEPAPEYSYAVKAITDAKNKLSDPKSGLSRTLSRIADYSFLSFQLRASAGDIIGAVTKQYPELGRWVPGLKAETLYSKAMMLSAANTFAFGKGVPKDLTDGIKLARERGVIMSSDGKLLESIGKGESKFKRSFDQAAFFFKQSSDTMAEVNGFITGWLAYKDALPALKEKGYNLTQQEFAEKFTRDTKANPPDAIMPNFMKNAAGDIALKYRRWQFSAIRNLARAASQGDLKFILRQAGASLALTGATGLPFAAVTMQLLSQFGVDSKRSLRELIGSELGDAAVYGIPSALSGTNISTAAGMGAIIPELDEDVKGTMAGILAGAAGSMGDNVVKAGRLAASGEYGRAIEKLPMITPLTQNIAKAARFGREGVVTESMKGLIPKDEISILDQAKQLLGFQPLNVAKAYEKEQSNRFAIAEEKEGGYNKAIGVALARDNFDLADALELEALDKGKKVDRSQVEYYRKSFLGDATAQQTKIPKKMRRQLEDAEELYD